MEDGLPPEYRKVEDLKNTREVHDTLITKGLRIISDSYTAVFLSRAAAAGAEAIGVSREGKNFEELLCEADEGGYGLVALGRLGLGAVPTSRIGSVAERVARRIRKDILIAGSEDSKGPILVAIDGSPASFGGLGTALELSRVFNRPVEAVAAFDPAFHQSAFRSIAGVLTEEAGRLFRFNEQEKLHEEIIDKGLARIYRGTSSRPTWQPPSVSIRRPPFRKGLWQIIKHALQASHHGRLRQDRRHATRARHRLDRGTPRELAPVLISSGELVPDITEASSAIEWTGEATAILGRIPQFARGIVKNMVEDGAREKGLTTITASFMREIRKRMDGQ
jgi:nucleotide-binding universal stress UspA family protein